MQFQMSTVYYPIVIFLILSLGLSMSYCQVKLIGKIENYDGESVVSYNPTLDGISSSYLYSKQVKPNAKGEFEITFSNTGIGTLRLTFDRLTYSFIHESTSRLLLTIDQSKIHFPSSNKSDRSRGDYIRDSVKQVATKFIDGDFSEINRYYNKTFRSATRVFRVQGCDYSILLSKAKSTHAAMATVDSLMQNEIKNLVQIKSNTKTELPNMELHPAIYDYIMNQVKAFYWNVFLNGMMLKRNQQMQTLFDNPTADLTIYNMQWELLIDSFLKDVKGKINLDPTSFESIEFMLGLEYAASQYRNYDVQPIIPGNDEYVLEKFSYSQSKKLDSLGGMSANAVLAYKLHNLSRFLNTPTFYSPTLLTKAEELQRQNGNSPHVKEFADEINKLRLYLKAASSSFSKAVFIDKNYLRFQDLLLRMKGENVLIDIWATWCAPCFKDFEYKDKLQPFLDQGQLKVLYISLDKEDWEKRWKENVNFHKLEGYHVLASDVLVKDMWEFLDGQDGRIPRYVLINKSGKVFLASPARLDEGDSLINQIKELIESQNP